MQRLVTGVVLGRDGKSKGKRGCLARAVKTRVRADDADGWVLLGRNSLYI